MDTLQKTIKKRLLINEVTTLVKEEENIEMILSASGLDTLSALQIKNVLDSMGIPYKSTRLTNGDFMYSVEVDTDNMVKLRNANWRSGVTIN